MIKKFNFYTKWDRNNILLCGCLVNSVLCKDYKNCEILELKLEVYDDVKGCMQNRAYRKEHGKIKQTNFK